MDIGVATAATTPQTQHNLEVSGWEFRGGGCFFMQWRCLSVCLFICLSPETAGYNIQIANLMNTGGTDNFLLVFSRLKSCYL